MPLVWFPTLVLPLISFLPQFYPPTRHRSLSSTRTDGFRPSLTSGPHIFTQYIYCVVSLTSGTQENLPTIHFHSGHSRSDWIERGRQLGFQAAAAASLPAATLPSLPTGRRSAETPHRHPPCRLRRRSAPSAPPSASLRTSLQRAGIVHPAVGLGYVAPPASLLRPAVLRSPTPSLGGSPTSAPRRQPLLRGSRQLPC